MTTERYQARIRHLTADERAALWDRIAEARARPDARLIAYVVARAGHTIDSAVLMDFARSELPGYMVPARFVVVDALPLTATGKIDRAALPEPSARHGLERRGEPPRSPLERALARLWCDVLGIASVNRDDDFFAHLGGHSLLATRLLAAIRRELHTALPVRALFQAPTIAGLAMLIAAASRTAESEPTIVRQSREARALGEGAAEA